MVNSPRIRPSWEPILQAGAGRLTFVALAERPVEPWEVVSLPGRRWEIRPRCFGTQKTARFSGKQTMAGWKIPILNRKYIVKNGGFYIANVRLPECTPKMVRAPQKSNTVDGSEILQTHQVIYGSLSHGFTRCLYIYMPGGWPDFFHRQYEIPDFWENQALSRVCLDVFFWVRKTNMMVSNRNLLLQGCIFRCQVSFRYLNLSIHEWVDFYGIKCRYIFQSHKILWGKVHIAWTNCYQYDREVISCYQVNASKIWNLGSILCCLNLKKWDNTVDGRNPADHHGM